MSPAEGPAARNPAPRFDARAGLVLGAGGLLTGLALAAFLVASAPPQTSFGLDAVAKDDLWMASRSLIATNAATLVGAARTCERPLASIVVEPTGPKGGFFRMRSGSYVSAKILVTATPIRLALPYPAPASVGRGQILIENKTDGINVYLHPGLHSEPSTAPQVVEVTWSPLGPC